ncbi:uncharacterized protein LOC110250824 [Exaiptasia diaphana]|uniref:Uncharacterized protein n=1 Tax=Exaiptasia diaphana TaxID=2652724 RepID=A0A913Y1C7_EXADI|nr:uncharacterized protein LOC110250824 [Exaiptasia diaphana]
MWRDKVIEEMLKDGNFKIKLIKMFFGSENDQAGALAANPDHHLKECLKELDENAFCKIKEQFKHNISNHMSRKVSETDDDENSDEVLPDSEKTPGENDQELELEQNNNFLVPENPDAEIVSGINNVSRDRSFKFPGNGPHKSAKPADHESPSEAIENDSQPRSRRPDGMGPAHVQETSEYYSYHIQRRCQQNQCVPEIRCQICRHPISLQVVDDVYRKNVELNDLKVQISRAQQQIADLQQMLETLRNYCDNSDRIWTYFLQELGERKEKIDEIERELVRLENKSEKENELIEKLWKRNVQLVEESYENQNRLDEMQKEKNNLIDKIEKIENNAVLQENVYSAQLLSIENKVKEEVEKLQQSYLEMKTFSRRKLSKKPFHINLHV